MTESSDKPVLSRNNGSRSASNKNDNKKPASEKNNGNGKVNKFDISRNKVEYAKKSGKLKSEKTSQS